MAEQRFTIHVSANRKLTCFKDSQTIVGPKNEAETSKQEFSTSQKNCIDCIFTREGKSTGARDKVPQMLFLSLWGCLLILLSLIISPGVF